MYRRGLYVGRFQPFHIGHLEAVKYILKKVEELIIAVGSAQYSHTAENPFTSGERIVMIKEALREEGIELSKHFLIPVPDVNVHSTWVSHLVSFVPSFDVVFTNEPLTSRLFKEARFKVEPIPFFHRELYSATEIRRRILNGEDWEALLPKSVVSFLKEIDGVGRVLELAKNDKTIIR
ncbi:MAG: nicotinamide-nucleotide adenylyltransferase [Candidatus Bathyarchaeia archaeon]